MGQEFAVYSSDQVVCVFAGLPLTGPGGGMADGEFLRIRNLTDGFTDRAGAGGLVSRSRTNDNRGDVVVILEATSNMNDALSALHSADLNLPNGAGVGPLLVKDKSGRLVASSANCWIVKAPDQTRAKETGTCEWTIRCARLIRFDGGN